MTVPNSSPETSRSAEQIGDPGSRPARRRRRFSLSLRALMVLVLVIGTPMAWKARRASIQRRAVERIKALRGSVLYDWQYAGNAYVLKPATGPSAPVWLRKALGDEYFQEVAMVSLPGEIMMGPHMGSEPDALEKWAEENKAFEDKFLRPINEDQLACLEALDRLEGLVFHQRFTWTPAGLARLGRLGRLKELQHPGELDASLEGQLAKLTNLETLSIQLPIQGGPDDGATDLSFLDKMPKLRMLNIGGGRISGENMARIGRAKNLDNLSIVGLDLSEDGLSRLRNLHKLNYLSIATMTLTRESNSAGWGLEALEKLDDLVFLSLIGVPANHAALERLRKLPKLGSLTLSKSQLDEAAIQEFTAAKPGVSVNFLP